MIIHRHKAEEHRNSKNHRDDATLGDGNHPYTGESVDHCFAQIVEVHLLHCAGEISGHAAGKRVPCPGRIMNVFQRVRATTEELVAFTKQQGTMLAFFYGNVWRPYLLNAT